MDPCLTGRKWSLDIPTTRELIRKNLVGIPDVTINNIQVGGSGTLSVSSTDIGFTYSSLKIDVDITAADIPLPVSVIIDGTASGAFVIGSGGSGSGKACLAYKFGKGTAKATIPFLGQEVFDLAPGGGYLIDMDVEYTCNDGRMTIGSAAAQAPGAPGWGPFAYNAV